LNIDILKGRRILVVDDEEHIRSILKDEMEELGMEVMEASNGDEAFDIIKSSEIDIIISDVRMPVASGMKLLEHLSTLEKKPRTIMISGFSDLTIDKAKEMGAHGIMAKPFHFDAILEQMALVLSSKAS
jgi:YesN/AraC family two-component response regulator